MCGSAFVLFRKQVGRIFTDDPAVLDIIADISVVAAGCYVLLCLGLTSLATLDAQGRPGTMALAFFVGGWVVALPLAWLLAFRVDLGVTGLWYGMAGGYGTILLLSLFNVVRANWDALASRAASRNAATSLDDEAFDTDAPPEAPVSPIFSSTHL
eukprot:TRINITY_DN479_c0_g1_i2.p2 TRINITY_DN479_c0_g1~~TRINITY_DN479_c0_g1_i2.p2  ORF type:complete len:155 (+),score=34.87 TRINITY_DN479_c0_g1_i2:672-1136(+)